MGSRSCLAIPSCLAARSLAVFPGAPTRPLQNCSNFIGRSQNTMFPRLWTERSEGHDRPPGNLRISHQGHNEAQSTKKNPKGLQNEAQTVWGPRVGIILSYRFCCCEWVTLRKNGHPHKNQTTSVRTNCTCASRGMPLTRREVPSSLKKHSTRVWYLGFSCLQQKSDSENNCSGARPDRRGEGKLVGKTAARHACSMLYKMFGLRGARALRRHASERTRAHTSIE